MNLLDVFIMIFLITALVRGTEVGFVRQICSTVGFFGGLFLGAVLEGRLIGNVHTPAAKAVLVLIVVGGTASVLWAVGEYVGLRIKFIISEGKIGNTIDKVLGSFIAAVTLLLAVWLGTAIFRTLPASTWQQEIRTSRIVAILDRALPPAPNVLTDLGRFIDPNGFPQVFAGLEPSVQTNTPLPDMGKLNGAVAADEASVVKIEGTGCGGIIEGSGFVVGSDEIVTNAHVVAGVTHPAIIDQYGTHAATVVSFDPNLDIAILRARGINKDKPLTLNGTTVSSGTAAAVLGYPGDGGFTAGPAAIIDSFVATGRNIYNQDEINRTIYSIKADVEQGNSGGPLIAQDGSVIGVVFAKSTSYNQIGYALTMQQVIQEVNQAAGSTQSVSTGPCAE